MKNQQVELDEKTLTSVLDEHVSELKEIKDFIKQQGQQLDQKNKLITEKQNDNAKLIASFEQKYQKIEVIAPKPDTAPMLLTLANGMMEIRKTVRELISQQFEKNRVLVLPEDKGKLYLKIKAKQIGLLAGAAIVFCFVCWFGFRYLYLNSQNSNFRKVWYWNYMHQDSTGRKRMDDELASYKLSGVNSQRTDSIDLFQKRQENVLRIKELQREADSLKTINPYSK
ncbi:hypothetical protein [Mucilaginibacter paludis]|uniref:Uncharacterized protein n=1 Tax=Mucilaginibacter paludis DSM 18603 TaxID=714943 RepID=H1YAD9_9SPHI|nr:hypothetical protein [Mucilaginibacter paludis]EHQ26982.1 hypothetical protein Mucpa_2871 [Mucilaginibacter paludis DSM 18603]